ncbi:MAG: carbohydrate ABC transporter permease [Saccharofermentanales bacterium]
MSYQGTKINPTKHDPSHIKFYAVLVPLALFMILPILYIFVTAFKPLSELFAYPPRFIVINPTLENFSMIRYVMAQSHTPISRYLLNSIVSSGLVVISTLAISVSAGYVLSKKTFKGKSTIFAINTLALMFVPAAVSIPRYLVMENLKLLDMFISNVIPMLAMPVGLFLIKQFIDQIPDSLLDAAAIDGADDFKTLRSIVVPMVMPALVTVAILAFQMSWNSSAESNLYISRDSIRTFAFYLTTLTANASTNVATQGMAAAASLILFVPNLIVFIIMQGKVLNTMAHSGIK